MTTHLSVGKISYIGRQIIILKDLKFSRNQCKNENNSRRNTLEHQYLLEKVLENISR